MENENKLFNFNDEYTLDVQKKFICCLLYDKVWAENCGLDIIRPEYFRNYILKKICSWIHSYYGKYKNSPSPEALKEIARDDINAHSLGMNELMTYENTITEIFDFKLADDLEFFKQKAVQFVKQVSWQRALEKCSNIIASEENTMRAMDEFKKVLDIGTNFDIGLDMSELSDKQFLDMLASDYDPKSMIKTGIASWDEALGGGFVKKNIHMIGAAPGYGKSRTMAFLATSALKDGKKVMFISLELSEVETMANIKSSITGLGMHDMLKPENLPKMLKASADFKNKYSSNVIVKFFMPATISVDTIFNYVRRAVKEKSDKLKMYWKPDVIYIDYMDKILPTNRKGRNSYEDMGDVATECKNLAITFDCPVVTATQLGKFMWNVTGSEVIGMDAVAESSAKTHLCHSFTTINVNPAEKEAGRCRLYLAKSRSGTPNKVIYCAQNLRRCTLEEIPAWSPTDLSVTTGFTVKGSGTK